MGIAYLSDDWAKEVNNRLQSSEAVLNAAKGQSVTIQMVVTDVPNRGEVKYYFKLTDGQPEVGVGDIEGPEATINQNYETSVAVAKGELNSQNAFMQGKLKITGNLMKLMQLQGFFQALGGAVEGLETEY